MNTTTTATSEQRNARLEYIIDKAIKTQQNPALLSLATAGGTATDNEIKKYVDHFVNIGFCQPKFYKRNAWRRAKKIITIGIELKICYACDFGRGKGKYSSHLSIKDVAFYINRYLNNLR